MKTSTFAFWLLAAISPSLAKPPRNPADESCKALTRKYPSSVHYPGSVRYDYENEYGWSTTSWLGPACIFTPKTPEMVYHAIRTFKKHHAKFAVRGGGAMPVDDAANIGPEGVLLATTEFSSIEISKDTKLVFVGAGVRWPELYAYLDNFGVTVNGIRMGRVGVVGFLLGGGIGFLSYEHGIASTGIESFECVLGDGKIVTASLKQNPDLFWALRGGGNNFCIVTEVSLRTLHVPQIYAAPVSYGFGPEVQHRYVQSLVEFAKYGDVDPKASIEGQIRWVPSRRSEITFDAFLFHSGGNEASPVGLQNFTAPVLPSTSGSMVQTTMGTWANQFPYDSDRGNRKIFHFFSIPADPRAMEICIEQYFASVAHLVDIQGFFTAFSVMPITNRVIEKSTANGGNPIGLDADSAPSLWLVQSPSWLNAADDETILAAHENANNNIDQALAAEGLHKLRFVYLSDASKAQFSSIFPSYGQDNVSRLRSIRKRYDSASVFTKLLVGGVKVAEVQRT